VWLRLTHLDGDEVTAKHAHGGVDKAVNVYPSEHYTFWRQELGMPASQEAGPQDGWFGENFTTRGLVEGSVCIGDVYEVGGALVQVSQPRQPCQTLARRWGVRDFVRRVDMAGRMGWYLRVLQEGLVQAGDPVRLVERPLPGWTITRVYEVMTHPQEHLEDARHLAACQQLSAAWRTEFERILTLRTPPTAPKG
jgi:MOSC domain-containing protein YiiM